MEKSSSEKRTKVLKFLRYTSIVVLVLFSVLVVHIYQVTKPRQYDNNNLQLSRIDFKETIDSTEAGKIRHFVGSLSGVQNTMFNVKDGILVYGYYAGQQSSANVFTELMKFHKYNAAPFVVSEKILAEGCPMAGKDRSSFVYRTSAFAYHLLNK